MVRGVIMLYLDYSATTPVEDEVLDVYNKVCKKYWANANSIHLLGVESHRLMEESTKQIANLLKVKPTEVIFTSSASEANNLAIKGIAHKYKNRSNHIVTTKLEHSSVNEVVKFLEDEVFFLSSLTTLKFLEDWNLFSFFKLFRLFLSSKSESALSTV